MASRRIIGLAFEGSKAGWIVLDPAAGSRSKSKLQECDFDAPVSQLISAGGGEQIADAGARLKEALGGVKGDVAVSLPSDQVLLRVLDLPTTDSEEIKAMVGLQIDKMSPFPVENMVVAYEVVARKENSAVVAGLAVRRDVVHNAGELLKAADIIPDRVDVNSLVWWRLIKNSGSVAEEGKQVFIIFSGGDGEFVILQDGVPVLFRAFSRQEDQPAPDFMNEICDELGYALMSLELDHGSFTDFSISLWHLDVVDEDILKRPGDMCGGKLEVTSMEAMPRLAEGTAIRFAEEGAIDLTPSELIDERRIRAFRKKLFTALAGVGLVWLLSLAVLFGGVAFQRYRLRRVNADLKRINEAAMGVRELRRKVRTISLYTDRSRSALECIREVSLKQPGGVDLTVLSYKKSDSLKISGEASNVNLIYDFKKNMDTSALFKSVSLDGPKRIRDKEVFEIEAKLRGEE